MEVISAAEAKAHLKRYMAAARRAPIMISEDRVEPLILVSKKEYDFLREMDEDTYWGERALRVEAEGRFIGTVEGQKIVDKLLKDEADYPNA